MTEDTCCCAFSRSLQRILPGLNLLLTVLLLVLTPALLSRAQEAASTPAPGTPGGPIAQVNDQVLTEAAFHSRCERLVGGQADTAAGWVALKDWIQQTLAEEEAKKKNLVPNDQAIARRVDALRKQWEFRGVKFTEWLEEHGRSLDSVRTDVRSQLIAENLLTEGIEVKEAEVALFYANNKQVFGIPEQIKVSRITAPDRATLQKVEAALKKGTAFDVVAREHSSDPFALSGGLVLDPIEAVPNAPGGLEPEVLARALRLQPGKVEGPIKVGEYFVWVRLEEKTPARAPVLTDVQDLIIANLKVQKGGRNQVEQAQARLIALQKSAKIQIHRPEYRGLLNLLQPKEMKP